MGRGKQTATSVVLPSLPTIVGNGLAAPSLLPSVMNEPMNSSFCSDHSPTPS
jgi:hypothetical protein